MSRPLTASAVTKIAQQYGAEPITIIEVFWNGLEGLKYSDKDILDSDGNIIIKGQILDLASVDDTITIDGKSNNISVQITLDDVDGDLKDIINNNDIQKRKVIIYQHFTDLDIVNDDFILLIGEINTPINWNEQERKLTFNVVSKIESKEVGFSPEEGQFRNISGPAIGKNWPLAFGNVLHIPAVRLTDKIRGATQTLIGLPDQTLLYKYWQLIDRLRILNQGYFYYVRAILFLNDIARNPFFIIPDYVDVILEEDKRKQRHSDLSKYITENEKLVQKLEKLLDETNFPQTVTRTTITDPASGQGETKEILSTVDNIQQLLQDRADVQDKINQINPVLDDAKLEIESLTKELDRLDGIKKLLEIETENAEYAWKNAYSIVKKIEKLLIEYIKTQHEIYKITIVMKEQEAIVRDKVTVINGHNFPQDEPIDISIKGLVYNGIFSGDQFTVNQVKPRYENIKIGDRESEELDAFWLQDSNINIKGHYCLTQVTIGPGDPEYILYLAGEPVELIQTRIFKVKEQIGRKCLIELVELKPSIRVRKKRGEVPVLEDLPDEIYFHLRFAREHTEEQRNRILENSIEKFQKTELDELRHKLEKLKNLAEEASNDDEVSAVNETIYKNVHEYNDIVARLRFPQEAVEKAYELINNHEFKTLLKLCNLRFQELLQAALDEVNVPIVKVYFLTGPEITNIVASSEVMLPTWFKFSPDGQELFEDKTVIPLPSGSGQIVVDFLPSSTLWYAEPGSEVLLISDETEKFIANILPSTVKAVYAYKNINGIKQLVPIPLDYYTKNEADNSYLPLICTTITLRKSLKDYSGEQWEDGIYVSLSSSIGPNTIDILTWIIQGFTNKSIDATSFNHVRTRIDLFPSNFCLFDKKDALQLISEIAWQSRCTVYERNDIFYIKYLAEEPNTTEQITENDVLALALEYTSTEKLVTKFVAKWLSNYSNIERKNQVIVRYNIPKYGEIENEYDFYIYNDESIVIKAATFWSIRYANTWKIAKFKTPLTKFKIETFDTILLSFLNNFYASVDVKVNVDRITLDTAGNFLEFECSLPVRSGEMTVYEFVWPADLSVTTLYPTVDDINNGYAGTFLGSVPTNLSYKINPNINLIDQLELRPKDYGEAFPSDGAFIRPPNPLEGLQESDYIVTSPSTYQLENPTRIADNQDARATYDAPVKGSDKNENKTINRTGDNAGGYSRLVFMGKVTEVLDKTNGTYKIVDNARREYEVAQINDGTVLDIGQPVTAVYDEASHRYLINEGPSTDLVTKYFIAQIVMTATPGRLTSYICDIFDGQDYAALQTTAMLSNQNVIREGTLKYFYQGEVVAARKKSGIWYIYKLNETNLKNNFNNGELALRLSGINATPTQNNIINVGIHIDLTWATNSSVPPNYTLNATQYTLEDLYVDYKTHIDMFEADQSLLFIALIMEDNFLTYGHIFKENIVPYDHNPNNVALIKATLNNTNILAQAATYIHTYTITYSGTAILFVLAGSVGSADTLSVNIQESPTTLISLSPTDMPDPITIYNLIGPPNPRIANAAFPTQISFPGVSGIFTLINNATNIMSKPYPAKSVTSGYIVAVNLQHSIINTWTRYYNDPVGGLINFESDVNVTGKFWIKNDYSYIQSPIFTNPPGLTLT